MVEWDGKQGCWVNLQFYVLTRFFLVSGKAANEPCGEAEFEVIDWSVWGELYIYMGVRTTN